MAASGTTTVQLDWHLLDEPMHAGLKPLGSATSTRSIGADPNVHELDAQPRRGIAWVDANDVRAERS